MTIMSRENRSVLDCATEQEIRDALTSSLLKASLSDDPSYTPDWIPTPQKAVGTPDVENEVARLKSLLSFSILECDDSEDVDHFDEITDAFRKKLGVSWCGISLVDLGRQWFLSFAEADDAKLNLAKKEAPRTTSFCGHTILGDGVFVVPDASKDERFREHPAVTGPRHLRFYAGTPLITPEGMNIGSLCVTDKVPRQFSSHEEQELLEQANLVVQMLLERRDHLQSQRKRSPSKHLDKTPKNIQAESRDHAVQNKIIFRDPDVDCLPFISSSSLTSPAKLSLMNNGKRSRSTLDPVTFQEQHVIPSPIPLLLQQIIPCPNTENVDPDEYLIQLIEALWPGVKLQVKSAVELDNFFPIITEQQMSAYNMHVVKMARLNDVTGLRKYFEENGREALDCFNRFGEGLLNMACRRGFVEMAEFLLSPEVNLSARVRDDYGRTPLHDACWHPQPQLAICKWIMERDPSLFLVADKRGFTPFQYARKNDWTIWRQFLFENKEFLKALTNPDIVQRFSSSS
jgi:ankyrin repeat protein